MATKPVVPAVEVIGEFETMYQDLKALNLPLPGSAKLLAPKWEAREKAREAAEDQRKMVAAAARQAAKEKAAAQKAKGPVLAGAH
jgi:Tfp pilus assembly protein PilN